MSKTAVSLSSTEIADKWARRTKASISDIQAGIGRVTESPAKKAIAKQDKMKANLMKAIDDGRWAKGLGRVSLEDWKQKTIAKVGERLAGGVDAASSKRQAFDEHNIKTINAILPKIAAMPDLTIEDSVNRVRTMMEHMHKNKYKSA